MIQKGILVVVSGFSGVGKGTLMKKLVEKYDDYALSISATTRDPREGETDGREYFFHTKEEFQKMIDQEELVEYASYCDNFYGTPKKYVEDQMRQGRDVILEIEIQGALKIKAKYPDALLLFVMPPSAAELKERLVGRGTETEEVIAARLKRASEESDGMEAYDYMLVNDRLEECVEQMHTLISAQRHRVNRNLEFIEKIRTEVKRFTKGE
ncbi:MAG: guanylate kinase [Lachnospiraceae bacterium]|nr:guanylate kinase [Lachnospiraceae bacterium]MDD3795129.1 guanylate kinase [Lachnospiraceae bacterium]